MEIGLRIGESLAGASEWFTIWRETIFGWLQIPSDLPVDQIFRRETEVRILAHLLGEKWGGRTMDRGVFVEEMAKLLRAAGYKRPMGEDRLSIRSLKSSACLIRVWDFSICMAQGYSHWKSDVTAEGLENEPCYEMHSEDHKYQFIWHEAGGKFYGKNGRMIAHKTDPIWLRLSKFGVPWLPFSFDDEADVSLVGIDVDEAVKLGCEVSEFSVWRASVWWDLQA